MTQCVVTQCERKTVARGWCGKHYQRWYKRGDPEDLGRRGRHGSNNPRWDGGASSHPLYHIYHDMIARCKRVTHQRWKGYGGRGITVCDRWKESFWAFVEDMGERPEGLLLDRRDNDGGYEPANCRWVTRSVSSKNRRTHGWEGRTRTPNGRFV